MSGFELFVSYSHHDKEAVTELVKYQRLANEKIFYDGHIESGEEWEKRIWTVLAEVHTLIVFWCRHTDKSEWVRKEFLEAIKQGKRVVPVLFDDTQTPPELSRYQWLDFRRVRTHQTPMSAIADAVSSIFWFWSMPTLAGAAMAVGSREFAECGRELAVAVDVVPQ